MTTATVAQKRIAKRLETNHQVRIPGQSWIFGSASREVVNDAIVYFSV